MGITENARHELEMLNHRIKDLNKDLRKQVEGITTLGDRERTFNEKLHYITEFLPGKVKEVQDGMVRLRHLRDKRDMLEHWLQEESEA